MSQDHLVFLFYNQVINLKEWSFYKIFLKEPTHERIENWFFIVRLVCNELIVNQRVVTLSWSQSLYSAWYATEEMQCGISFIQSTSPFFMPVIFMFRGENDVKFNVENQVCKAVLMVLWTYDNPPNHLEAYDLLFFQLLDKWHCFMYIVCFLYFVHWTETSLFMQPFLSDGH